MKTATRLAGIALPDQLGNEAPLGLHWRDRPAVLVFIRHFG